MKGFFEYWQTDFYSGAVTFLLAVVVFIVSLQRKKQHPQLKPLIFFFLAYILGELVRAVDRGIGVDRPLRAKISTYLDVVETIIEFFAFFLVIKNYIVSVKIKKILKPLSFLFIVPATVCFVYYKFAHGKIDQYFLQAFFTFQAFLLIVACALYYVDLFTKEPKLKLMDDPSFWVITGLAFFMLCTLPFSILGMHLIKVDFQLYVQLFMIFEVFYWILFLMIIKAYFCKPAIAK